MKNYLEDLKNAPLFVANRPFVKKPILFAVFGIALISVVQIISQVVISLFVDTENLAENTLKGAYIALGLTFGLASFLLYLYIKYKNKAPLSTLGFGNKNRLKKFLIGFGIGALLVVIGTAVLIITGTVKIVSFSFTPKTLFYVLLMLPAWLIQASSEEIWFRGFYLNRLGARLPMCGIILSSIFFALGHVLNPNRTVLSTINILIVGLFAAIYTISTEDLFGACGWHTAWNFFQGNVMGFSVSGRRIGPAYIMEVESLKPNWISGGEFGIEGGIVTTILFLTAIVIMVVWKNKTKQGIN